MGDSESRRITTLNSKLGRSPSNLGIMKKGHWRDMIGYDLEVQPILIAEMKC